MPLEPEQTLGYYRVVEKIGEGGMGIVWKAEDTRLGRYVALKVLPDLFARDAERLARLEREARLLASLNHTNIAGIHGFEQNGETRFLVLELVTGETLAERISRGALPLDESLKICDQIAAALEAAHSQGILHRDLKPANVKVTPEGQVKVLDFGLAKAMSLAAKSGDSSFSPTITADHTLAGSIMGTAYYMSPEQARGRPLDRRSDVWSFGCILYETLTGRRPFAGETISDVIAKILQVDVDRTLLPVAPPGVHRLLTRCLQKDPEKRLRDIGDARLEIQEALSGPPEAAAAGIATPLVAEPPPRRRARALITAVGLVTALALGVVVGWLVPWSASPTERTPVAHLEMLLPADAPLAAGSFLTPLSMSPDAATLVYVGVQKGTRRLYLRDLERLGARPLPGTEGAEGPFFSPDGQWVGFHADGKLKKVSVRGGLPVILLDTIDCRGAAWGPDGTIVFAGSQTSGLSRISGEGGAAESLTTLESASGEWSHRFPQFLPDGQTVIFASHEGDFDVDHATIWAYSLRSGKRKRLMEAGTDVRYVPTGHLVFVQAGTLLAVPFDTSRLDVTGPPRPLVEGIAIQSNTGAAHFSVAPNGTLAYVPGGRIGDDVELVWVARDGKTERIAAGERVYRWPKLSPDGRRIAIQVIGANTEGTWIGDAAVGGFSASLTRFSRGVGAIWSLDGSRMVYGSMEGRRDLHWRRLDGTGKEELLIEATDLVFASSTTPDGRTVAYTQIDPVTKSDIYTISFEGGGGPQPFLKTRAHEGGARFSKDGRYVAYVSDETGRFEVYVTRYPDAVGRWQVTSGGGRNPVWSPDGRELFFQMGDNLLAAPVETTGAFRAGPAKVLLEGLYEGLLGSLDWPNYDVGQDGRFLMVRSYELEANQPRLNLVIGWDRELKPR